MGTAAGPRVAADGTGAPRARRRPTWVHRQVLLLVGLDALAATAASAIAPFVRFGREPTELLVRSVSIPYAWLAVAIVPTWLLVLGLTHCYDIGPFGTGVRLRLVVRAGANFLATMAVAYFVLQVENLRRGYLTAALALAVLFTLGFRVLAARGLRERRRRGEAVRRALIVGSRPTVAAVVRRLGLRRGSELLPVGACVPDPDHSLVVNGRELPVHGTIDDVLAATEASQADAVVLTGSLAHGRVQRLTWALEGTGVDVFVVPALAHHAVELDVRPVAGLPLVYVDQGRHAKRDEFAVPGTRRTTARPPATPTAVPAAAVAANGTTAITPNGAPTGPANATTGPAAGNGSEDGAGANGTPAYCTPGVNGTPAYGTPVANGTPANGTPVANGTPANGTPANGTPVANGTPARGTAAAAPLRPTAPHGYPSSTKRPKNGGGNAARRAPVDGAPRR